MLSFSIGRVFKVEVSRGDFLLRGGRRELYWNHATGWSLQRLPVGVA